MTIINNKNLLGTTCKNCYSDIISKKIDPMFRFLDCNNDGKVSAEDLWKNFKHLKKPNTKYDIYGCKIKEKRYRTNSINDFFIKNMKAFDGFLTKEEFRVAILLGYWDRQTDVDKIYKDDTRLFKQLRWGPNGDNDIVCQRILSANNPPLQKTMSMTAQPNAKPAKAAEEKEGEEKEEKARFYN